MRCMPSSAKRKPRYSRPLISNARHIVIPRDWEDIPCLGEDAVESRFIDILRRHDLLRAEVRVPLVGRYTPGRRWSKQEFEAAFDAWASGISLTRISAALNRNPQDIIFRLLDECSRQGIPFTEKGRGEGSERWTPEVATCAAELFSEGLPAWRIAVTFRVDFEYVEKALFAARPGYGHKKFNPFAINTEHKLHTNATVLSEYGCKLARVLDAFAGEGATTALIERYAPNAHIVAIESDPVTYACATSKVWRTSTTWINSDNRATLLEVEAEGSRFDLIDLDPFVTCHEQILAALPLLADDALLFVTLGGEYRRSFIGSNRKAIAARYGFVAHTLENSEYLEAMPFYFGGFVARAAALNGFVLTPLRAVRYANNCRFWFRAMRKTQSEVDAWIESVCTQDEYGTRLNLQMPRFAEVRHELQCDQLTLI
jgi:16S rRNA G966 N2-methylase RsmD